MLHLLFAILMSLTCGAARVEVAENAHDQRVTASRASVIPLVQGRGRIDYHTSKSVRVFVPASIVMGGFRVFGSYRSGVGPVFPTGVNGSTVVAWPADLAVESEVKEGNWYSVFSVANDGDTQADFLLMPYFTVRAVTSRTVRFGLGGEGQDFARGTNYSGLDEGELAGADVLLIEEGKEFSRRTVSATANTSDSITLTEVGGLARGDRILAAPAGYDRYAWVADFYIEGGGEPRNIADTGEGVGSLMSVNMNSVPASGAVDSPVEIDCRSYISPLASDISIFRAVTLSTASTGSFAEYFWHDASKHSVVERLYNKVTNTNETIAEGPIVIPFSKTQSFYYSTGGTLAPTAAYRSMQTRGWTVR